MRKILDRLFRDDISEKSLIRYEIVTFAVLLLGVILAKVGRSI